MQNLVRQLKAQQDRRLEEASRKWAFDFRNGCAAASGSSIHRQAQRVASFQWSFEHKSTQAADAVEAAAQQQYDEVWQEQLTENEMCNAVASESQLNYDLMIPRASDSTELPYLSLEDNNTFSQFRERTTSDANQFTSSKAPVVNASTAQIYEIKNGRPESGY